MIEPLCIEFDVECSLAHAFAVWTEDIDVWCPSHTASGDPARVVLEPRVGGRLTRVPGRLHQAPLPCPLCR